MQHFPTSWAASPQTPGSPARQRRKKFGCLTKRRTAPSSSRKSLQKQPKRRYGMSCAADTGWQKRGFDGLYNVFTMKISEGLPRVTSAKRTLESVIPSWFHILSIRKPSNKVLSLIYSQLLNRPLSTNTKTMTFYFPTQPNGVIIYWNLLKETIQTWIHQTT